MKISKKYQLDTAIERINKLESRLTILSNQISDKAVKNDTLCDIFIIEERIKYLETSIYNISIGVIIYAVLRFITWIFWGFCI